MSKPSEPQPSRRQLLLQGAQASLGFLLLPQQLKGQGNVLEQRSRNKLPQESLLTLAAAPDQASTSKSLSPDPITVTIHFTAKANQAETLLKQLSEALQDTRQAPGCRYAQVYVTASNPNQIVLFKGWDSRAAQEKYLNWEQSSGKLAKLLALVDGDPRVEYWEFQAA